MSEYKDGRPDRDPGNSPVKLLPASHAAIAARDASGPAASGLPATAEIAEPDGLGLAEYWRIALRRKWLVLGIALTFVVLGGLRTLMMTPLYTSTVRLQIDRNVAKIVEGGNVTPVEGTDVEFLKTQYELLQSRTMAERVASALKLGEDLDFLKPRDFSPFRTDTPKDRKG